MRLNTPLLSFTYSLPLGASMSTLTLGVDFGTSNSAAGVALDGKPHLIEMAPGQNTLPTAFFFDFETRKTLIGDPAVAALLNGEDGRFMRALKRLLGTSLMHEKRQILNERVTFVDIVARFLRHIKTRADQETGQSFDRVLSGRPVVFHGTGTDREAKAEADLRLCYEAAGFTDVRFMPEPEAAAIGCGMLEHAGEIGLIVDIGGGTSDFSLFRSDGAQIEILANHGIRFGGTDFDRAISISHVMPLLGKDTLLRKVLGDELLPAPNAIFNDLATWEKIPFLYTAQTRRMVADMLQVAQEPAKMQRLANVLEDELGHELAFSVERGKIAANAGDAAAGIDLSLIERALSAPASPQTLARVLSPFATQLQDGADATLKLGKTDPAQVSRVIYVGGSSLMNMVSDSLKARFPDAKHQFTNVFTAVADGLALAAAK